MADEQVEAAVAFTIDNWEALGVQEHDAVLHLPASIKRRNKSGGVDEVPVLLRNVTNMHKIRARTQSRELALRLKLELDRDTDQVEQLENYALLAYAVRDPKTYDQHVPDAETLLARYDTQSLAELWGRFNVWVDMLDPRFGLLDADQLWQVIARIAREKTPAPLVGLRGAAQFTGIVFMAQQSLLSPSRPSWLASSATSTPAS
jgi:hypothetical protein